MHQLLCVFFVLCTSFVQAGLFQGMLTNRGNNPAFQCNHVTPGQTYDNVIVEARVKYWENEDDDTYTSEDCENMPFDDCDMRVSMFIDDQDIGASWPKRAPHLTEVIHKWDGNDIRPDNSKYRPNHQSHSFIACKYVPHLSVINVRTLLEDVDKVGTDIVNKMNCQWSPKSIGTSRDDAKWETINCCTAFQREMDSTVRHELKIDVRAYRAPGSGGGGGGGACPASGKIPDVPMRGGGGSQQQQQQQRPPLQQQQQQRG